MNAKQFSEIHPELWKGLHGLLNSKLKSFPCLYAISSFNKGAMYFGVSIEKIVLENIANDLKEMSVLLNSERDDKAKTLNTYVHVVKNMDVENVKLFLINLFQELHNIDEIEWLENATKDMNSPDFKFCFNGQLWFPVLLTPDHPTAIRCCPYTIIAFQPSVTFDHNKQIKPEFFQRMRSSTHRRIDDYYHEGRPYYLSEKSSGKNIIQFIGVDLSEFDDSYKYPDIGD